MSLSRSFPHSGRRTWARRPGLGRWGLLLLVATLAALGALAPARAAETNTTLRINSGGGAYTDAAGNAWLADTDFTGGATWSFDGVPYEALLHIRGTPDPWLYSTVRYSATSFGYTLPAAPGSYTLKLNFVEGDAYVHVGGRIFNVLVNGSPVLTNFDVYSQAGGGDKPLDESFPVTVPAGSGAVTVTFQTVVGGAMVSAVQLVPAGPVTPTAPAAPSVLTATPGNGQVSLAWQPAAGAASYRVYRGTVSGGEGTTPIAIGLSSPAYTDTGLTNGTAYYYVVTAVNAVGEGVKSNEAGATPSTAVLGTTTLRINSGGGAYTDAAGHAWQADADYTGGATWSYQGLAVTGTSDPDLYRDVRYSGTTFGYSLPATPGSYALRLHFVEGDPNVQAGGRLFNVLVNGATALNNLDVFAQAGGTGRALDVSLPVTVPAGGTAVMVSFQTVSYTAMVSSLELVPAGPITPAAPAPPSGLTAAAGNGQIALSWQPVAGATSYNVYRGTSPGAEGVTAISTPGAVTGTSYPDVGLSNGTTFYYTVTAVNAVGESARSGEASATPNVVVVGATTLRINSGGGAYTDAAGNAWLADTDFTGGATWSFDGVPYEALLHIRGTPDPWLYSTVRYSATSFGYTLPAAPGSYTLKLNFVEGDAYVHVGGRIFNVLVNGSPVLTNFDVYSQAGGGDKPLDESFPVTVPAGSGAVTVTFQTVVGGAMVSAVQLVPGTP